MARHALIHRHHDETPAEERALSPDEHVVAVSPRERYGGTNWGACFFGWLVAVGVTVLLAAITSAVATAVGTNLDWTLRDAEDNADTVGVAAAIAIGVIMLVGYYAGGYVAGRMSRFDAARQGVGVWLIGLLAIILAGGATAIFGSRYDLLERLDLPSLDVSDDQLTLGAVVVAVALVVVMLVGALAGSAVGRRYHRRIDAVIVEH
jgi:amino acid transporter